MAVTKEIKETISVTIDEVLKKMSSLAWIDRQKLMEKEVFKNTEKILYCFSILKEHVSDEKEYIQMIKKNKSGGVIRYSKNKIEKPEEDELMKDRIASYMRSKSDVDRIEKALKNIENEIGYEVIEYRYLKRKETGDTFKFEEIATILAGNNGYNENLNEKTVRNYKNTLVKKIAIYLFGSDAI